MSHYFHPSYSKTAAFVHPSQENVSSIGRQMPAAIIHLPSPVPSQPLSKSAVQSHQEALQGLSKSYGQFSILKRN